MLSRPHNNFDYEPYLITTSFATPRLTHRQILTLMASLVLSHVPFELSARPVSVRSTI